MTRVRTISIKSDELKAYGLPYSGYGGVEILDKKITGVSRLSIHYEIVFKWVDGKFYRAKYAEYQDEEPWEFIDNVECVEVKRVYKLVEKFVEVWEEVN